MTYTEDYKKLSRYYHPGKSHIRFDEEGFLIVNQKFHSHFYDAFPDNYKIPPAEVDNSFFIRQDKSIAENREFIYPIIKKINKSDDSKVIILLHGLNERTWDKYLPWGKALCLETNHPVILFPISFHMNRSPKIWSDPRKMSLLAKQRKKLHPSLKESSFVNAAISSRLEQYPQRFFLSGLETYFNLNELIEQLQNAHHPVIQDHSNVNFFGYSIGALLTQIMLMSNPEEKLTSSKAFIFCGGTTLDKMNGISRFILDSKAFEAIKDSFVNRDFEINLPNPIKENVKRFNLSTSFHAMMNSSMLPELRNSGLSSLKDRIKLCPLIKDSVIPAHAVKGTFSKVNGKLLDFVQTMDFSYQYTHERPFPCDENDNRINEAFEKVFRQAAWILK